MLGNLVEVVIHALHKHIFTFYLRAQKREGEKGLSQTLFHMNVTLCAFCVVSNELTQISCL